MPDIAAELGVSKSSVSTWARDVEFEPGPRKARKRGPNKLQRAKAEEIERLRVVGRERVGFLTDRDLLIAGTMLYAGEGDKADGEVGLANSDPRMIAMFCLWLRHFFEVEEHRLRLRLYLHEGLDLQRANQFWAAVTNIPLTQFSRPYRAVPDATIRQTRHEMGCPKVRYSCSRTHRAIMGLVDALLPSIPQIPG